LAIWYVLITCIFRCPSILNDLNETSPRICKSYLTTVSYLQPHLEPYYNTYAAPYVEKARPYAEQLNQRVISPASQIAINNYQTHAAPRIEYTKAYAQQQWEKTILPQVHTAQKKAHDMYGASIAPHIEKASLVVEPHYGAARDHAINIHRKHVMPAFEKAKPHLYTAYGVSQTFLLDTGIPYVNWVWSSLVIFVDGTLWPQMRALYGDNVKPQLVMISERIAKYQEGRKLKASMEKVESSMSAASKQTAESTVAQTPEIIPETPTPSEEHPASKSALTTEEQIEGARKQIATDLHTWQEKFAKAADKGSEDLQDRVKSIINGLIRSEVDQEGHRLLTALNKTVEKELINYKSTIVRTVSAFPKEPSTPELESAEKGLQDAIRESANSIRDRASAIRKWHAKFEANIAQRAEAAADSTLDVLDGIRDLGLQEIGMRWAWMDGVTYKDWAKYHGLKKQFDSWRNEVREVATKHEVLDVAKTAAGNVLEDAMNTAQDAALELVRLKDVGKWKIHAHDATNNFESRAMPAGAVLAASKVAGKINDVSESLVGDSQGTIESIVARASDGATGAADTASSVVMGSSQGSMESIASKATEAVGDAANSATPAVMVKTQGVAESIVSKATQNAAAVAADASTALRDETSSGALDNAAASASLVTSQVGDLAHSAAKSIASGASSASSIASSKSSKIFAGAMAQEVPASAPIFDDLIDDNDADSFSEKIQSVVSNAGDKYADVTKAVSEALLGTSQGGVESMSSVASEQYSNALAAASSVLYGTTQGTAQSITSVASERYSQAVSA
jgi:hypothetical protein